MTTCCSLVMLACRALAAEWMATRYGRVAAMSFCSCPGGRDVTPARRRQLRRATLASQAWCAAMVRSSSAVMAG